MLDRAAEPTTTYAELTTTYAEPTLLMLNPPCCSPLCPEGPASRSSPAGA